MGSYASEPYALASGLATERMARGAPNGTFFIAPPSLREGREESSGEGKSNRNSSRV